MSRIVQTPDTSVHDVTMSKGDAPRVAKIIKKVVKPLNHGVDEPAPPTASTPAATEEQAKKVVEKTATPAAKVNKIVKKKALMQSTTPKANSPITKEKKHKKAKKQKKKYVPRKELIQTKNCIPCQAFSRLVKEVTQEYRDEFRFQAKAMQALQCAAEDELLHIFKDADLACEKEGGGRVTLMPRDMELVLALRKRESGTTKEVYNFLNKGKGKGANPEHVEKKPVAILPTIVAGQ